MTTFDTLSGDGNLLDPNSTETIGLRSILDRPDDLAYVRATRKTPVGSDVFARYYRPPVKDEIDERIIAERNIIDARLRGATDASLEALGIFDAPELTTEQSRALHAYEVARREALHQVEVDELRRLGVLPTSAIVTIQLSLE